MPAHVSQCVLQSSPNGQIVTVLYTLKLYDVHTIIYLRRGGGGVGVAAPSDRDARDALATRDETAPVFRQNVKGGGAALYRRKGVSCRGRRKGRSARRMYVAAAV